MDSAHLSNVNDLFSNRERYIKYTWFRTANLRTYAPRAYSLLIKALPYFLHTNNENNPGYVPGAPTGIPGYICDEETMQVLEKTTGVQPVPAQPATEPKIEMVTLTGTAASILQTDRTVYRVWLGTRPEYMVTNDYKFLRKKAKLLQNWFLQHQLVVKIYQIDVGPKAQNKFGGHNGKHVKLSPVTAFKDEFFRTATHIAGSIPFFWITPENTSSTEYLQHLRLYKKDPRAQLQPVIDLGFSRYPTKSEFLPMALNLLALSLASPYHAYTQISELQSHLAGEGERIFLPAYQIKRYILAEDFHTVKRDPFVLQLHNLEHYFKQSADAKALDMLRTCFYLKARPLLNFRPDVPDNEKEKVAFLKKKSEEWGWDTDTLKFYDSYPDWPINEVLKLDKRLKDYILKSFISLTKSTSAMADTAIDKQNLTVLTRKMVARYGISPGKIKTFCYTLEDQHAEKNLTLLYKRTWRVYRGKVSTVEGQTKVCGFLYAEPEITDICAWMAVNRVCHPSLSKFTVFDPTGVLTYKHIYTYMQTLGQKFILNTADTYQDFLEPARILKVCVTAAPQIAGASPLSIFTSNSWGEIYIHHFRQLDDIAPLLGKICRDATRLTGMELATFMIFMALGEKTPEFVLLENYFKNLLLAIRRMVNKKSDSLAYIAQQGKEYLVYCYGPEHSSFHRSIKMHDILPYIAEKTTPGGTVEYTADISLDPQSLLSLFVKTTCSGEITLMLVYLVNNECMLIITGERNHIELERCSGEHGSARAHAAYRFIKQQFSQAPLTAHCIRQDRQSFSIEPFDLDAVPPHIESGIKIVDVRCIQNPDTGCKPDDVTCFTLEVFNQTFNLTVPDDYDYFFFHFCQQKKGAAQLIFNISAITFNPPAELPCTEALAYKKHLEKGIEKIVEDFFDNL